MIFHNLVKIGGSRGSAPEGIKPNLMGLVSGFPKSKESVRIGDVIIEPKELWHLPEMLEGVSGVKDIPRQCEDLSMTMYILMIAAYFLRAAEFEEQVSLLKQQPSADANFVFESMFTVAGVCLSGYIYRDRLDNSTSPRGYAEVSMERSNRLAEYCRRLYETVLATTSKYS